MQSYVENLSINSIDTLINYIKQNLTDIMTDNYGNYLIQKLISLCSSSQLIFIIDNVLK